MRICLVSTAYPPSSTEGIARQRQVLARALVRLGHEVVVVACGAGQRVCIEDGVQVRRVALGRLNYFSSAHPSLDGPLTASQALYESLERVCDEAAIDIVDVPLWQAQGFVLLRQYQGAAVVWLQTTTAQLLAINGRLPTADERALLALEQICLQRAAGLLGDSAAALATTLQDYGVTPTKPVGVALLGLPALASATALRPTDGRVEALVVGRLEQRKGIDLLFAVLPQLLERHPQLRVRFLGRDNSANDGWQRTHGLDYPAFFRRRHPTLAERVAFEGYVSEAQLAAAYGQAHLLIAPARYESFGLVYLEAMRAGLPVVACAAGGASEIFELGEAHGALLVAPADAAELAAAIDRLVADAPLRQRLGAAGLLRFAQAFSAHTMAQATLSFYRQVLNQHTASAAYHDTRNL